MEGRALKAGEFSFNVERQDGNVVGCGNDAEGKIKFSALEFKRGQKALISIMKKLERYEAGVGV